MANELRFGLTMAATNGSIDPTSIQKYVDQAVVGSDGGFRTIGNGAEEDLTFVDITTQGFLLLQNLDLSHKVSYGPKSGGVMIPFGEMKPGEFALMRLTVGVVVRMIAAVAPARIRFWVLED